MERDADTDSGLTIDVSEDIQDLARANAERIDKIDKAAATNPRAAQVAMKFHGSTMNAYLLTMLEVVVKHLGLQEEVVEVHAKNVAIMLGQAEVELEATKMPKLNLTGRSPFPRSIK